jgi:hypothetical protein
MRQCQQPNVRVTAVSSGQHVAWPHPSRPLLPVVQCCLPAVTNAQAATAPARPRRRAQLPQKHHHRQQLLLRWRETAQQKSCQQQEQGQLQAVVLVLVLPNDRPQQLRHLSPGVHQQQLWPLRQQQAPLVVPNTH